MDGRHDPSLKWTTHPQIKRDIEMWNNKQYIESPCLVKEDKFIKSYRMWFKQFYTVNSVTYKDATEGLDW